MANHRYTAHLPQKHKPNKISITQLPLCKTQEHTTKCVEIVYRENYTFFCKSIVVPSFFIVLSRKNSIKV